MPSTLKRRAVIAGLILSALLEREARADNTTCVSSFERGQAARDAGKLVDARRAFISCSSVSCPNPLRSDCAREVERVDSDMPSIVVAARDANGSDLFDVKVTVDGAPFDGAMRGSALPLDPGPHVVRLERTGADPVELKILLRTGELKRQVVGTIPLRAATKPVEPPPKEHSTTPPSSTESTSSSIPLPTWILGGVAVLGLTSFTTFAILGNGEKNDLQRQCVNRCTDDQISTLKSDYIIADVSLVVSVIAAGVATYFALSASRAPSGSNAARSH